VLVTLEGDTDPPSCQMMGRRIGFFMTCDI
jgi:hypothetical protein